MIHRNLTLLCTILLLGACSPSDDKAPPPKLFADQREALDQAKTIAAEQQKALEQQQKEIEKQTQ
ncbi:MAG: hypothetical protein PHQ60_07660 [Sideroxydans sp.]|nr:hypothetical protein [Sideroxydans sp.]